MCCSHKATYGVTRPQYVDAKIHLCNTWYNYPLGTSYLFNSMISILCKMNVFIRKVWWSILIIGYRMKIDSCIVLLIIGIKLEIYCPFWYSTFSYQIYVNLFQGIDCYGQYHFNPTTVECRYNAVQYCKITTRVEEEYQSDVGSTKDSPYLALTGEVWGVFCEYFWENWPRYNSIALYFAIYHKINHGFRSDT